MVPAGSQPSEAVRGLRLEARVALGQRDPGLRAAGPEVRGRPQPGGIVQRARPQRDETARWRRARLRAIADPSTAFRADPAGYRAPAVGGAPEGPWLAPREAARLGRDHERRGKSTAGEPLADGAMAGVGHDRRPGDLVAEPAAQAAAGLR